jgi:hypothetical protein
MTGVWITPPGEDRMPDWNGVEVFVTIVHEGSYRSAARSLDTACRWPNRSR